MFKKFNWEIYIIFVLVGFILFILFLIYQYQLHNNSFDLVTEKYYEEELSYQDEIDAYKRTNNLDSIPTYFFLKKGILIQFPNQFIQSKIEILLRHPFKKELDIKFKTSLNSYKNFIIHRKFLEPSVYLLQIKWKYNNLNYRKDYEIQWK